MTPQSATYLSIVSILLINTFNAQTGKDCAFKTCSEPGQIRIDALFDSSGDFIGGCHCGCDPGLYDSNSASYCDGPKTVNFDPRTLVGDCSCNCPFPRPQCSLPLIYDETECECLCPLYSRTKSCNSPAIWRSDICACTCESNIGSIGGPCIENGQFIGGSIVKSDCTCDYSNAVIQCPGIKKFDTASGECKCPLGVGAITESNCNAPRTWNNELCFCGCAMGSIGGPCVANGQFIYGSIVKSDCACDYGSNSNGNTQNNNNNNNNNQINVGGNCGNNNAPCSNDQHCCSTVCRIGGVCL